MLTLSSTLSASFTTSSLLLPKTWVSIVLNLVLCQKHLNNFFFLKLMKGLSFTSSTVPTNLPTSLVRSCVADVTKEG